MDKHPVCWWEIASADAPRTVEFMQKTFDWEMQHDETTGIWELNVEGDTSNGFKGGGVFTINQKNLPPHSTIYIPVENIEAMAEKVEKFGGKILQAPFVVPDTDFKICVFTEPQGQIIGMIERLSD